MGSQATISVRPYVRPYVRDFTLLDGSKAKWADMPRLMKAELAVRRFNQQISGWSEPPIPESPEKILEAFRATIAFNNECETMVDGEVRWFTSSDPEIRELVGWIAMQLEIGEGEDATPVDRQIGDEIRKLMDEVRANPDGEFESFSAFLARMALEHPMSPKDRAQLEANLEELTKHLEYLSAAPGPKVVTMPARGSSEQVKPSSIQPGAPKLLLEGHHDTANAHRFLAIYGSDVRWCGPTRKHLLWDGRRWSTDEMEAVRRLAMGTMLEYYKQAVDAGDLQAQKFARSSLDYKRLRDMLEVTKPLLAIHPSQLDVDPMLLNFLNGTLDLESGILRPHQREDYITKLVHHNYHPDARCPLFLGFLGRIMGAHPDASGFELERADRMVDWFQKAFGYTTTGRTGEKVVFVCYGRGNNGKTTLLSLLHRLISEYSTLIQIDSLMTRQQGNNTDADLADLRGARFVMTSETQEGQHLNEARLKRIVQGVDGAKIKATRKYENPITFPETHKIWIDANHKPIVRGSDGAVWNRLVPIPIDVVIPADEIDTDLPRKLMQEAEGILAWIVTGALRWRSEGLGRPDEIRRARSEWRKDSEPLKDFFDECCARGDDAYTQVTILWTRYLQWCYEQKVDAVTRDEFRNRLEDAGFAQCMHRFDKGYSERAWAKLALR